MAGRSVQGEGSSTAIGPVLRELRRRFREGSALVGRDNWRAWWLTIVVGVIFMVGLMVALKMYAKGLADSGALAWETDFLLDLGENGPFRFSSAVFFQTFGTDITLIFVLTSTIALAIWNRRPITALSIFLAALVADLTGRLGWMLWDRARPDILHDGVASPGFHSFPSGHTSKTMAIYGILVFLWLRHSRNPIEWLVALVMLAFITSVVPLGRMTMGVHWPSDIAGGLTIGFVWMLILIWALRYERTG